MHQWIDAAYICEWYIHMSTSGLGKHDHGRHTVILLITYNRDSREYNVPRSNAIIL